MTCRINTDDDIDFMLSAGARRFEFPIETAALQRLLDVAGKPSPSWTPDAVQSTKNPSDTAKQAHRTTA